MYDSWTATPATLIKKHNDTCYKPQVANDQNTINK